MKILLVIEASLGGSGRHVVNLCSGLLRLNHEVHLVFSKIRMDSAFSRELEMLRLWPHFRAQELGVRRELSPYDLFSYVALTQYVRQNGPFDILHAHSTKAGFLTRLIPFRRGAACLYTPHALMTLNPELRGLRRSAVTLLEAALARLSDAVIVVSKKEQIEAVNIGISTARIMVIHNGVDSTCASGTVREQTRNRLGLDQDTVCIACVGRLVEQKRPDRLLQSLAILTRKARRRVCLIFIGWGPLEASLRESAARLGLLDSVRFLGEVPTADYLSGVDILAQASTYEGFAYTFLEALVAGIPIVSTEVGGIEETVETGVNGFICNPWNAETFATMLVRLVDDEPLRNRMSDAAQRRSTKFTVSAMIDATLRLYQQLRVEKRSTPQPEALPARTPR